MSPWFIDIDERARGCQAVGLASGQRPDTTFFEGGEVGGRAGPGVGLEAWPAASRYMLAPMSDASQNDLRAELAGLVEETRRHLVWMRDAGQRVVRKERDLAIAPALASTPARAPGAAEAPTTPVAAPTAPSSAHARPSFLEAPPKPKEPSPMPSSPVRATAPLPSPATAAPADPAAQLKVIRDDLGDCQRCALGSTRTQLVFGQGNPKAEVLFLGEGPGEDEDRSGLAFVGRAGQLLTKMIEAMGFTRDDVYICNIVKCRPPGNRRPEPDEVEHCRPFVEQQIRAIAPQAIVALGATAVQSLLRTTTPISRLRNHWQEWQGIAVMPTFHPSYLLRAPAEKGKAWDDLKLVLQKLGRPVPARK